MYFCCQFQCCKLILRSLVFHNYCIRRGVLLSPEDDQYADNYRDDMTSPIGIVDEASGVMTRENLVNNYFTI